MQAKGRFTPTFIRANAPANHTCFGITLRQKHYAVAALRVIYMFVYIHVYVYSYILVVYFCPCVYVCTCVSIYVYIYIYIYMLRDIVKDIHIYAAVHACMFACKCMRILWMCVCICVCLYFFCFFCLINWWYVCVHVEGIYVHVYKHAGMYVCIHACISPCLHVSTCTHILMHIYVDLEMWPVCVITYTYMYLCT